jgi:hypothetical protein
MYLTKFEESMWPFLKKEGFVKESQTLIPHAHCSRTKEGVTYSIELTFFKDDIDFSDLNSVEWEICACSLRVAILSESHAKWLRWILVERSKAGDVFLQKNSLILLIKTFLCLDLDSFFQLASDSFVSVKSSSFGYTENHVIVSDAQHSIP